MKKILTLLLSCFLLFSCSETKTKSSSPILSKNSIPSKISWEFYKKYCGDDNANAVKNFELLKGKTVTWKGIFSSMPEDIQRGDVDKYTLKVKMPKSDSVLSDITLRFPSKYYELKKQRSIGDEIIFQGKIGYLGGGLSDHIIHAEKIKYLPPKKPKKVVR